MCKVNVCRLISLIEHNTIRVVVVRLVYNRVVYNSCRRSSVGNDGTDIDSTRIALRLQVYLVLLYLNLSFRSYINGFKFILVAFCIDYGVANDFGIVFVADINGEVAIVLEGVVQHLTSNFFWQYHSAGTT